MVGTLLDSDSLNSDMLLWFGRTVHVIRVYCDRESSSRASHIDQFQRSNFKDQGKEQMTIAMCASPLLDNNVQRSRQGFINVTQRKNVSRRVMTVTQCSMLGAGDQANYVRILDTTLRDGEQSPGVALSVSQKVEIAKQLARLRVDVIDAGFPATSAQEAKAVKMIADHVGSKEDEGGYSPIIAGFCRCVKADIDAAWEAVKSAKRPRILTFISTSEIHMKHKLNKSPEEVLAIAKEMVAYARSLGCEDIHFGAEDSGRTNMKFLCDVFEGVIEAGATTVGIGDTVGYLFPSELDNMVTQLKQKTRGIEKAIISVHCHNDLGLATSNTLAGALAGARQLEVSINGIGERAGNASLEEVVMAMKCRTDMIKGLYTGIDTKHIYRASQMVAEHTGMLVQPNKAIVGANAFTHESGVHQDGMLKNSDTYQILVPSEIGISIAEEANIVLGKHSGRHALNARLVQLGYKLEPELLNEVFQRFKEIAVEKKIVQNTDLKSLVNQLRIGAPI